MMEKELVQKYFEGTCTAQELRIVLKWLNDDAADHTLLQELMTGQWEKEQRLTGGEELKPRLLSVLQQRLYPAADSAPEPIPDLATASKTEVVPVISMGSRLFRYGMVACMAGLLLLAAWLVNQYRQPSQAVQWSSLSNTGTGMKYCMLPDSSRVWLHPNSTLSWATPFREKERAVRIQGQAFFDVARDTKHPFVVYSDAIVTKVLGTAFNIEAYAEEKEIRVSLVSGKVAVSHAVEANPAAAAAKSGNPVALLDGGEMLTYTKGIDNMVKEPLRMTDMAEWTSGHLIFSDIPVSVALERLAALYHLHLHFQDGVQLDKNRFSTVFTSETPEQMIQNILFITDYTYRLKGKEVEIMRR